MTDLSPLSAFMTLPRPLLSAFERAFPGYAPDVFVRSPGRVNLLGGHVDLHDGMVINIAINREIWLAAAFGSADLVQLHAADLNESATFSLKRLDEKADIIGNPLPGWAKYAAGVAWALQRRGLKVNGLNVAFLGNVTMRAGLSSSGALEEAFAVAWQSLESWRLGDRELAQVGLDTDRDYLGLGCGIQDHYTCLHARSAQTLAVDCRALEHQYLPLPAGAAIVICDTNTRRELTESGFNARAQDAHDALETIRLVYGDVTHLRDVSLAQLQEFEAILTEAQFRRARHVVTEIERVQQGIELLRAGETAAFGALMNASYHSARDDYGSSSAALDQMWQVVAEHPACFGARYTGGGEAGAVVALVRPDAVEDFIAFVSTRYKNVAGRDSTIFPVEASAGAGVFV